MDTNSQSNKPGNREYVNDQELERRTSIKRVTWQLWRREPPPGGGPPWAKIGSRCIYEWSTVEAWIEARMNGGAK